MRSPIRRFKPLLFILSLLPLLSLLYRTSFGGLGVNPVETLLHALGIWSLRFLFFTLLITPLRLIPGWSWLTGLRRMMGFFAFFYATLHLAVYVIIDQQLDGAAILEDIIMRPFITLGLGAYLLMLPLVVTSNHFHMSRLGTFWKRLHSLIYLITALVILHFYLVIKTDFKQPLFYATILSMLVILRIVFAGKKATRP